MRVRSLGDAHTPHSSVPFKENRHFPGVPAALTQCDLHHTRTLGGVDPGSHFSLTQRVTDAF